MQNPDGGESYVRTGSLNIDALGVLRAGNGMPVMGNGGPIAVPPEQQIEVGEDGTISIRAMGEGPRVMAEVDRIKLVNPDLKNMNKGLDGSIHTKDGKPAQADADVKLVSGFLRVEQRQRRRRNDLGAGPVQAVRTAHQDDEHRQRR